VSAWGECQGVTVDVSNGAVTYPADVADGNWHHYVVVVPDIEEVNLAEVLVYKDGTLLSDSEPHEPYNFDQVLNTEADGGISIGRFAGEPTYYFNGVIDEVAIFNTALSAEEIRWHYEHPGALTGNEAGLVGYWDFDNDDGQIVMDRSPYGNHGKLGHLSRREPAEHGFAEVPSDGETLPELTEGASGYGYYFDGDGDYIEIGPIDGLGPEQTKMLWVYADPFETHCNIYLIDEGGDESNNNWIELCGSDGNAGVQIRAGFDGANLFDSNSGIYAESWHHIVVVSTAAGEVETYVNGALDSWRSGFSAATEPKGIVIGADGESRTACFKGIIDEVAIFNRPLSADEIWKIYQNVGRPKGYEQGLVGYWNFDSDQGDVVRDRSRHGNHGKLGSL
jgi:hypothetical protein